MSDPRPAQAPAPVRLVVADDSEDLRMLIDIRLRHIDDIDLVALATDGLEAVDVVDAHLPDVVLMDMTMPGLDGLAATARIHDAHPEVRVLVLTGHPPETVAANAAAAGAAACLRKDMDFDELMQLVRATPDQPVSG